MGKTIKERVPYLKANKDIFISHKIIILNQWISYNSPKEILLLHDIDTQYFIDKYASGVFDYFMGAIEGTREIGDCPVMQEFLTYLKFHEISADELFELCSNFRRSMIELTYDMGVNSKEAFEEISYLFDKNFKGILKFYTDSIFQKLIDARQEALKASQAKEYFLSNMSHEIRTPLNAILGFVNLLMDEDISIKHRNYLNIILNSGENLLSIINDILDFSKLRSGEFTIEPKVFSLHEELSHTVELFVASATSKNITITSFIDPKIPKELFGDILRIKQIVSNFLSNAIKFTPVDGIIKVNASYYKKQLQISVTDNGYGISEVEMEHIFVAFTQAQSNKHNNKEGTGLGLCISHQLAELMNGRVYVNSKVGEGSTFCVDIPVEAQSDEILMFSNNGFEKLKIALYTENNVLDFRHYSFLEYGDIFSLNIFIADTLECDFDICIFVHENCSAKNIKDIIASGKKYIALMSKEYDTYEQFPKIKSMCFPLYCSKIYRIFNELLHPELSLTQEKQISNRYKGHILVAEDNQANQELLKIILDKYGLTYDMAVNGKEALEFYKLNKYDLILMDEQMPVMSGTEAIGEIIHFEESNGLTHTPVSALTANVLKGSKERGLLNGFDAFLGKPLVLKELERLFVTYLKIDSYTIETNKTEQSFFQKKQYDIRGLDTKKLMKELMLNDDELILLLTLFLKKVKITMRELLNAIETKNYKKIGLLAHSLKGSSGNFRLDSLQKKAYEIEKMAKLEKREYDYKKVFFLIQEELESIKLN